MKKICLFILFTVQFIFASEASLKIENFVEDGGTVTFDIMISNDVDVQAVQLTLLSGKGIYDDTDACECSFECDDGGDVCWGVLPDGCTECYYDNGVDFVANSYEEGYYSSGDSDSGYNGCSEPGGCGDLSFSNSSDCEEAGSCDNGSGSSDYFCFINGIIYSQFPDEATCEAAGLDSAGDVCDGTGNDCTALGVFAVYSSSDCNESGACSDGDYTNQCDCLQNEATWTSHNLVWSPTDLWTSYDLPYICDDNGHDWNYANQDASGDDYRVVVDPASCSSVVNCGAFPDDPCCTTEFQFCRMPGINSTDPSSATTYGEYQGLLDVDDYDVSGHCSQVDSYCRDEGGCPASSGLTCDNGFPNDCCNNSLNPDWAWQSPHRDYVDCTENGFTWTAYETQAVCETYGGIWVGSESGTQGNNAYDLGENFIDSDKNLDISSITNLPAGFFSQEANDEMLIFAFGGGVISSSVEYSTLATITATITGASDDIITLGARNICKDDYQLHCVSEMIVSDSNAERMDVSFTPSIWEIGSGAANLIGSTETNSDNECSLYAGETIENDSTCPDVCGDGICEATVGEDYISCKMDCPDPVEGDGYCNLYEDENSENSSDCTAFGCGDYACSDTEDLTTCASDCLSYCGDGYCDVAGGENGINCNEECGNFVIGDEDCASSEGENYCISPNDCTSSCGDGCYDYAGGEDGTCVDYQITCGDGVYHYEGLELNGITPEATAETYENCLGDYIPTCGDGYYDHSGTDTDGSETADSCDVDYVATLGDGVCDDSENPGTDAACTSSCGDDFYHHSGLPVSGDEETTCPEDYPDNWNIGSACGDGICDGGLTGSESAPDGNGENVFTCASDCSGTFTDGYCDENGLFGTVETSSNASSDCNPTCGDGVCTRFDGGGDIVASEDNQSCSDDCTFNMCGDGECQTWWSEAIGTDSAGTCDLDCSTEGDDECTFGENDSDTDWYSYDDCYNCGDGTCEEGSGETVTYGETDFCYADCWTSCGDGVCEGPENPDNCLAEGSFELGDGPPWGDFIFDDDTGDCMDENLNIGDEFPKQYYLSNNYPNPFNPVTTINYSVKNAGNVKIDIYNILGQHVYTLVDGYHVPGNLYQIIWDSSTQSNTPISSGIYFYRMVSEDFNKEVKMTIIK